MYRDEGASAESIDMILFTLSRCCDPSLYRIRTISANDLIEENWEKNCVLIVFPGGAANPYHRKLSEICGNSGNARIKEFVRNGGSYLGLCAGAYYGCRSIEFDKERSLEVVCDYELDFFDGRGVGPAMKGFEYCSARGSYAARFAFEEANEKKEAVAFFKGGPYFVGVERVADGQIPNEGSAFVPLASFMAQPGLTCPPQSTCCVECAVGKGKVVLCSIHIEWGMGVCVRCRYDPWELKMGGSIDGVVSELRETKGK